MHIPIVPSRRGFLAGVAGLTGTAVLARPARAHGLPASEFGIEPDRDLDQTEALQRAIDAARVTGAPVVLPPGRYKVHGLILGNGARLTGVPGATRLSASGGAPLIAAAGGERVALSGLVLDGRGAADLGGASALVDMRGVARFDMDDCEINGSPASGLSLDACGGRISRSRIAGVRGSGLFVNDGSGLDIEGNDIADCGDNGILVWQSEKRSDGARVVGNRVSGIAARSGGTGQNGNGINIFRAGGVTVADNHISDCAFSAVRCNAADAAMIRGNMCRNLGEVALYVEFGFEGAIVADNIVDGAATGISVTNFNDGGRLAVISGNLLRRIVPGGPTDSPGIGIGAEADTAVTGNVIEDAGGVGLSLGWGRYLRDVTASGNIIRRSPIGIGVSVAEGAGAATITGNTIADAARGAILGMVLQEVVTGDLATGGAEDFPQLTVAGNRLS